MIRDDASERQVRAASPAASTWLSANAGSGKTRVLTDRVARLLLAGVEPQRVLCLTYTKAAASEMQNRLFRRLGSWAMLPDDQLRASLAELGADGEVDSETLAQARRLFARAIETPGGLKIQTIHSFCASLLRRFPLEAGVTPQFVEMDDRAATLLREAVVEEIAGYIDPEAVQALARLSTAEDFNALTAEIARHRSGLARIPDPEELRALFGLPKGADESLLLAQVFLGDEAVWLPQVCAVMAGGKDTDVKNAATLSQINLAAPNLAALRRLEDVFLTGKTAKEPFTAKIGKLPTKALQPLLGDNLDRLNNLMARVETARAHRIGLFALEKTSALYRFSKVFLPEYAKRKAARGWLDFDDLIVKARQLLTDPSVAQWVLFRLDGGIDHILVDEAQDTSPEQWRVIELLAQEFTSGQGARDTARTIFVVGDKKQSIYSFQGADLRTFDAMRDHFSTRLSESGMALVPMELEHSFRSSRAILRLVDLTFDADSGRDLGGRVHHLAFRQDLPGRVDLWPVIAKSDGPEPGDWFDPVDMLPEEHHDVRLARTIAAQIKANIQAGTQIPTADGPRPMRAGDVLILVQRRSVLFSEIIRACKAADLPIAGADRLKLGAELAVKDLAALLAFLATPEDDLSLAAALRSPLFGWTEGQLYDLAQGRQGILWKALREQADRYPDTVRILHDLRDRADFLRPFDLIERALTRHDGRQRLLARLGAEAEDGIDELLSQALAYERNDVPSLTGFLTWLETDDVEIKRQMDSAGNRIRVMTVHGAKGLEAPVVILPDTADRTPQDRNELFELPGGTVVWKTPTDESPASIAAVRAARKQAQAEENLRLLYVAMTRAQCWLIVAAAGETKKPEAWYNQIGAGVEAARSEFACTPAALDGTSFTRLSFGDWPPNASDVAVAAPLIPTLAGWATHRAAEPERAAKLLSPSDLGGAKALAGEAEPLSEEAALRRGRQLHLLLEHLPATPPAGWQHMAEALLSTGEDAALAEEIAALLDEASTVLTAPHLQHLFAADTLAEVPVTAEIAGRRVFGIIDRLLVGPDRVLAVDYKSNAIVPDTAADVPEGLLRQMGAYAAALAQIYPDHRIETAILWTRTARLLPLAPDIVAAALRDATIP
jgi:ATP-dependent helicase/nuclease subunit A